MSKKVIKQIDYNKELNSRCFCGKGLNWIDDDIIMLEPCEHLIHKSCGNKIKSFCPLCHIKIEHVFTEEELWKKKDNPYYYQKYVDLISVRHCNYMSNIDKKIIMSRIPKIISLVTKIPFIIGKEGAKEIASDMFNLSNVELIVKGIENIPKNPKVIIVNHTSDCDYFPIYYLFQCPFLSSTIILKSSIGQKMTQMTEVVIVNRGEKPQKTVMKMRKCIKKYGSICVFPEGLLTHPDTIIRFRTGAFNIGYQVCPVVINYEPNVGDTDMLNFAQKFMSQEKLKITVTILPPEQPPFSENKIEKIRAKMAKAGNMALARTINRDIRDE